jgi:TetR/AcrR family transcriptional regulator, tetracycline repressor protein
MALYRHVDDMDEIVAAVVDDLLRAESMPAAGCTPWRTWLAQLSLTLRHLFVAEPGALGLFTRRAVTTPQARVRLESTVALLVRQGFDEESATRAYAAVHTYTIGFCALESARRHRGSGGSASDDEADVTSARIRGFVTDEQFVHGLDALVDGLAPEPVDRG